MLFDQLFGTGNQATLMVALISLMGASLTIGVAMAMAIHYLDDLDEPLASMRQIVLTAVVVLVGFYAIINWPKDEPINSKYGDAKSLHIEKSMSPVLA